MFNGANSLESEFKLPPSKPEVVLKRLIISQTAPDSMVYRVAQGRGRNI
jgi:hypothetical protein